MATLLANTIQHEESTANYGRLPNQSCKPNVLETSRHPRLHWVDLPFAKPRIAASDGHLADLWAWRFSSAVKQRKSALCGRLPDRKLFCMLVAGKAARLCPACSRRLASLLAHMDFADEGLS